VGENRRQGGACGGGEAQSPAADIRFARHSHHDSGGL
jgi:hypothetical protein